VLGRRKLRSPKTLAPAAARQAMSAKELFSPDNGCIVVNTLQSTTSRGSHSRSSRNNAMAKDELRAASSLENEETRSLLSEGSEESNAIDQAEPPSSTATATATKTKTRPPPPFPPRRQSSFAQSRPPGTPRTPHRVRFEVEDGAPPPGDANGHPNSGWVEEEDYMTDTAGSDVEGRRNSDAQRLPLLTDIEAPSITLASAEMGFHPEDLLESARPKSGLRNAFMNMANSIM
jgi:solute carrier family 38 (sodium-coupled neutral amino acid transporter), member 11